MSVFQNMLPDIQGTPLPLASLKTGLKRGSNPNGSRGAPTAPAICAMDTGGGYNFAERFPECDEQRAQRKFFKNFNGSRVNYVILPAGTLYDAAGQAAKAWVTVNRLARSCMRTGARMGPAYAHGHIRQKLMNFVKLGPRLL